jgi:hypothetical protein
MNTNNFANQIGYSDITPYEVVNFVSDKTIEVREMKATIDPAFVLDMNVGGFMGNCSNQSDQKWTYESDLDRPIIRIRKGKQGWKSATGEKFSLSDSPKRYYDYNF